MKNSKEFMLLFRFSPDFNHVPTEAEQMDQEKLWGAYIGNLAITEKLVSTAQLDFTGCTVNALKDVSPGIFISEGMTVGGNLVITINSLDEAIEIAKECPIISMGGQVEIREILPMN